MWIRCSAIYQKNSTRLIRQTEQMLVQQQQKIVSFQKVRFFLKLKLRNLRFDTTPLLGPAAPPPPPFGFPL